MLNSAALLALLLAGAARADEPEIPPGVTRVEHDPKAFRPDPSWADLPYGAERQLEIYGGKHANPTARPMLELGRELYREGPFRPGRAWLGRKNLLFPHLMAFGDWRNAVGYNDNGLLERGILATRLNLDVDMKLTASERVHAFIRPLERKGQPTRLDFGPGKDRGLVVGDFVPQALFFEGDLARMYEGLRGKDNGLDIPFSAGLMPLLFQNGVWVEDAFTGAAFTVPAKNSRLLDISNMDVTFFAGIDKATTRAVADDSNANLYGVTSFIEANEGYWEAGYGYTDAQRAFADFDYHNVTAAFTRRYAGWLSNSVRVVGNFGQNRRLAKARRTADGAIILIENSLITRRPLTLVPYLNLFVGFDKPQSLARDAGAGGILKNTGILFETDGVTGIPKLDDTGQDTVGGAFGLEYLFDLRQQVVLEVAEVHAKGGDLVPGRPAKSHQRGVGLRWQKPLDNAWILRADAMAARREQDRNIAGARLELRRKF